MNSYKYFNQEQKITNKKKKVAAYCRVSTDHDDQANSFASQCMFFKQYIEHHPDWELYEIFADMKIANLIQTRNIIVTRNFLYKVQTHE